MKTNWECNCYIMNLAVLFTKDTMGIMNNLTVMFAPLKRASCLCQIRSSQNPQNKTPSTAGWLKNMVRTFSKFVAFRLLSVSNIVSSVIHNFSPDSASLSSRYYDSTGIQMFYSIIHYANIELNSYQNI